MQKDRILIKLRQIEAELSRVSERLYHPRLENSEYRELIKKKKKLLRNKEKLKKKTHENQ